MASCCDREPVRGQPGREPLRPRRPVLLPGALRITFLPGPSAFVLNPPTLAVLICFRFPPPSPAAWLQPPGQRLRVIFPLSTAILQSLIPKHFAAETPRFQQDRTRCVAWTGAPSLQPLQIGRAHV